MPLFGPPNVEKMKAKNDVQGLIKALSYQKDYSIQINAAKSLGEIGDVRAVDPLIAILKMEAAKDVKGLIKASKDPNSGVRRAAALGKIGKPAVAQAHIRENHPKLASFMQF